MPDIVDAATRSRLMAGIKDKDTKLEMLIRKALHHLGYRYRLHDKKLPGKPDIVLPRYKAVLHVHGCFWHMHDCRLFKWPSTRQAFWQSKLTRNRERDGEVSEALASMGWRQILIWECAVKGKTRKPLADIMFMVEHWLESDDTFCEIRGHDTL